VVVVVVEFLDQLLVVVRLVVEQGDIPNVE
jgi:hypothetical protein